ncbi:MAG: hypothetical protein M1821_004198 [Bathelium mastoideum]|nr:MAG: hypothetical protein M1821_004198 [Bathelium mastoideum]
MGDSLNELRSVIQTCPVIDNHAHNLLVPDKLQTHEFTTITTEAQGHALEDVFTSLPHIRAANQLKELYGCDKVADWNSILAKRAQILGEDTAALIKKCLSGIHTILMDDGLDTSNTHPYHFHDQFTTGKTRRIVRIETEAENVMKGLMENPHRKFSTDSVGKDALWVEFAREYEQRIKQLIHDQEVVGFKSVVCYRTGLDVEPEHLSESALAVAVDDFHLYVDGAAHGKYRIEHKGLNDFLVGGVLQLLTSAISETGTSSKPVQFHTGLGDSDMNLIRSNPAHLQPLIEKYPHVPFVILHSSYPYTREAGYLATVFSNAYLDIGEVFPMLSRDGQLSVLRQALELTPTSKLLWSTDGHFFPETYWLSNQQFRHALKQVLTGYVADGDLSLTQAVDASKAIMYRNSNKLYKLELPDDQFDVLASKSLSEKEAYPARTRGAMPISTPNIKPSNPYDLELLEKYQSEHQGLEYIFISWLDYTSTTRTRMFPISAFQALVQSGKRFTISNGTIGILANDALTPVCDITGVIHVEPDLSTLCRNHVTPRRNYATPPPSATVLASWRDASGNPHPACPRSTCERLVARLAQKHNLSLTLGFEIEVVFLNRSAPSLFAPDQFETTANTHAWSTQSAHALATTFPHLHATAAALAAAGIPLAQFHAESGLGQFEFVLPPRPARDALATLLHARAIIATVAEQHGLHATLHPLPFAAGGCGNGAHVHASLVAPETQPQPQPQGQEQQEQQQQQEQRDVVEHAFWTRGVLRHLRAICAFALPLEESYARVADDTWSGGAWVAWGTQNREVPLRRIPVEDGGPRWEVRCVDGVANMWFVVAAIVAAGLLGLEKLESEEAGEEVKDCLPNPSKLSPEQRAEYGIHDHLPQDLEMSLGVLEQDTELASLLGEKLVKDYIAVKRAEREMLGEMENDERRIWLIGRY